ncbi:MAG: CinA family nicotinamide mononucleotide deamidase-related protein [Nitriliruptoraceae bacterium]
MTVRSGLDDETSMAAADGHMPIAVAEPAHQQGSIDGVQIAAPGQQVRAALLSVGSELLLGDLTDSNATWLSRQLTAFGVDVVHHMAARDDLGEIVTALRWLAERVHLVIVGGGLGPTNDDLTREAVAAAAGVALEPDPELEAALRARFADLGRPMAAQNIKQARIPATASIYPAVGTAPAFGLTLPGEPPTRVIALPGVPWEMKAMFTRDVAPEIRQLAGTRATVTRSIHVTGRGESDVAAVVEPMFDGRDGVILAFLAHSTEIEVRLTVTGDDPQAARTSSQPLVDDVVAALGASVAGIDDEGLEQVVVRLLRARGETVTIAESATVGDVAARLGKVPGASHGLRAAMVVYTPHAKHDLLGPDADVDGEASVSHATTAALAEAIRQRFDSDWGLATTGVAGPDPVGDAEPGTVTWALVGRDRPVEVEARKVNGDRALVISRLGTSALDLLRRRLVEG